MPTIEEILDGVEDFSYVGYNAGSVIPKSNHTWMDCSVEDCPSNAHFIQGLSEELVDAAQNREIIQAKIDELNTVTAGSPHFKVAILPPGKFPIDGRIFLHNTYGPGVVMLQGAGTDPEHGPSAEWIQRTTLWFFSSDEGIKGNYFRQIGPSGGIHMGCYSGPNDDGTYWQPSYYWSGSPAEMNWNTHPYACQELYTTDWIEFSGEGPSQDRYILSGELAGQLLVGDTITIEVLIDNTFVQWYSMEGLTYTDGPWEYGWKRFKRLTVISVDVDNNKVWFDAPLRYPLANTHYAGMRYRKTNLQQNVGLRDVVLSNAIFYDDAWRRRFYCIAESEDLADRIDSEWHPYQYEVKTEHNSLDSQVVCNDFMEGKNCWAGDPWIDQGKICKTDGYHSKPNLGKEKFNHNRELIRIDNCENCFIENVESTSVAEGTDSIAGDLPLGWPDITSENDGFWGPGEDDLNGYSDTGCPPPGLLGDLFYISAHGELIENAVPTWPPPNPGSCSCWCTSCPPPGLFCWDYSDSCADGYTAAPVPYSSSGNPFNCAGCSCNCVPGSDWADYHDTDVTLEPPSCFDILDVWDTVFGSLIGYGTHNVLNETRHILSDGLRIVNSKNVTVRNTDLKLPINRGIDNGILFNVDKSNEILFDSVTAYRGRHNFSVGEWGTSGIVFNKVTSEGGWAFGTPSTLFNETENSQYANILDKDIDFFSRYQRLEVLPFVFGYPGFSGTHKSISNSILVTDSDIYDGWFSVNKEHVSLVANDADVSTTQGISTTKSVFWNVRGRKTIEGESCVCGPEVDENWSAYGDDACLTDDSYQCSQHQTFTACDMAESWGCVWRYNDLDPYGDSAWQNMSVPGMGVLASFQPTAHDGFPPYENGGLIVGTQDMHLFADVDIPLEFVEFLVDGISYLLGEPDVPINNYLGTVTWGGAMWLRDLLNTLVGQDLSWFDIIRAQAGWCQSMSGSSAPCVGSCNGAERLLIHMQNYGSESNWGECFGLNGFGMNYAMHDVTISDNMDITVNMIVDGLWASGCAYVWKPGNNWNTCGITVHGIDVNYSGTFSPVINEDGKISEYILESSTVDCPASAIDFDGPGNVIWNALIELLDESVSMKYDMANNVEESFGGFYDEFLFEITNSSVFIDIMNGMGYQSQTFTLGGEDGSLFTLPGDTTEFIDYETELEVPNLYEHQKGPMYQEGDVNMDGLVNVVDIVNLVDYVIGETQDFPWTPEQLALMDVNQDGVVNVVDIVNIVNQIFGTLMSHSSGSEMRMLQDALNKLNKAPEELQGSRLVKKYTDGLQKQIKGHIKRKNIVQRQKHNNKHNKR